MKLLRRTVKNYILYSTLLLVICTPIFYFAIQQLFIHEMEEELFHHKENFIQIAKELETEKEIELFELINEEFKLTETTVWPIHDSVFSYTQFDSLEHTWIPYRALQTGIQISDRNYQLLIRESIVSNNRLVAAIVIIQVVLLALLLTGLILINRKLSHEIWDPFYTILDQLKQYEIEKDKPIELPYSSTAEFRDLSKAIVLLVNKSREAYLSQKEFTENASHELQTPIAIFRSKLELLIQTASLTKEQAELISHLLDTTDRVARLNKNLLLLSKIENRQFLSTEVVSIKALLNQTLGDYQQLAQSRGIKIVIQDSHPLFVKSNPMLLEILLSNLISNAIRHAPAFTEVKIEITDSLYINNSGSPLKWPDKIFNRFNQESRSSTGSGLGLAIAKKICEVEKFQLDYFYKNSSHNFKISFQNTHSESIQN